MSPHQPASGKGKIRRILSTKSASATTAAIFGNSEKLAMRPGSREAGSRTSPLRSPTNRPQVDENRPHGLVASEGTSRDYKS